MEYYGKGIAQVKISISYRGYLNFKAELPLVACNTCRPGTSTAVLNCFYTARTGWRFILSRRTAELNLQLSLSLSSTYQFLYFSYTYSPPSPPRLLFSTFSLLTLHLSYLRLIKSNFPPFLPFLKQKLIFSFSLFPNRIFYLRKFSSIQLGLQLGESKIS